MSLCVIAIAIAAPASDSALETKLDGWASSLSDRLESFDV
jgi:hypothetical protein